MECIEPRNCFLCKCKSEYIDNGKIVSQDELKDNLKRLLNGYHYGGWMDTLLKYFVENIDSFEDCCNEIFWIAMKYKLYDLFDKCIECDNLKLSDRYFYYENYDVISDPYYIEKFEKKGKYFSNIEIESLFNHYITKSKEIDESIKYYISKGIKIYKSNYDNISIRNMLKLINFGFTNIDYVKYLLHKIQKKRYLDVISIVQTIGSTYNFTKVYKKMNEINKTLIEKYKRNRAVFVEFINDKTKTLNDLESGLNYEYCYSKLFQGNVNDARIMIENKFLQKFDEDCKSSYRKFATCLRYVRNVFYVYHIRRIKIKLHLQKVLCSDIVRYIETFY